MNTGNPNPNDGGGTQAPAGDLIDMDIPRRSMLLERCAGVFDNIPMADPVVRVQWLAKGVQAAFTENEALKDLVKNRGYIQSLHALAQYRKSGAAAGTLLYPPALKSTFEAPKEGSNV